MTKSKFTLAFGLVSLLLTAGANAGPVTEFSGSRADVRSFCDGAGYHLLEGGNFSLCTTPVADVVCRDDGLCTSSDIWLALEAGFQRIETAAL